ncbi:MAG: peptidylprolyl isomerase [Pseudodesulfovibrio sp.]|nr:peptidylprolyl isomerase [Pseudodesulfovibrio sp.]
MKKLLNSILLLAVLTLLPALSSQAADLENTLYLDLEFGRVVIEMRPDLAPAHVERIKELVRSGFYDGLKFHRVIPKFMAQTGDPTGTGTGGSGRNIFAEFSDEPFKRGTVGMARAQSEHSADSQFFICFAPAPSLNGKYTVWGQVTEGMKYVDMIRKGYERGGMVAQPDEIVTMSVAADVEKAK